MTDVDAIRAAVAGGWCVPPNTTKEMDVELGEAIVQAMIPVVAAARAEGMREALELNTAHSKLWRALGEILECPGISPNATVRRMARIAERALIEDKFSVVKPVPKFTAEAPQ